MFTENDGGCPKDKKNNSPCTPELVTEIVEKKKENIIPTFVKFN